MGMYTYPYMCGVMRVYGGVYGGVYYRHRPWEASMAFTAYNR